MIIPCGGELSYNCPITVSSIFLSPLKMESTTISPESLDSSLISSSSIGYGLTFFTLLIGFILLFLLFRPLTGKKTTKRDSILFLGPSQSGKTYLTRKLAYSIEPTTVMSAEPSIITSKTLKYSLIDFPGHQKFRSQLTEYLKKSRKIVFLFDCSNTQGKIREAAEFLYDILTNIEIDSCNRMLIVCNKNDLPGARPHARVRMGLQEELEKIKKTRRSLEDGEETNSIPLGRADQRFTFEKDSPIEIFFTDCSAKTGDLTEIIEFIES